MSSTIYLLLLLPFLSECTESSDDVLYAYPRILSSRDVGDELKIGVRHNSTELVLLVHKNRHISGTYKILVQDEEGNLVPQRKAPSCQYSGRVIGYKHSLVVISLCDGIKGKVEYGREEFRIRPVEETSGENYHRSGYTGYGEDPAIHQRELERRAVLLHELYAPPIYTGPTNFGHIDLDDDDKHEHKREAKSRKKRLTSCTMNNDDIMRINGRKLERRFVEVSLIVDREQHRVLGNNRQKTTDFVEDVMNHLSVMFMPYNTILATVQLTLWTGGTPIRMPGKYKEILDELAVYRSETLLRKRDSDVTMLITGVPFMEKGTIGGAFTDKICDDKHSANVNHDLSKGKEIPHLSTLIAHELGHVMGMYHDSDEIYMNDGSCECPCHKDDFKKGYEVPEFCGQDDRCIMATTINRDYKYFSLCSRHILEQNLLSKRCLFNSPELAQVKGIPFSTPRCGNAIVEKGEMCDCGSVEDCPLLDPCCEVGTCQLKNTSSCYTGPCCSDQCQFKAKGTQCRGKAEGMECDFVESCNGHSSTCPSDTYKQDGRTCKDSFKKEGFCSKSDCRTHLSQCQRLFGPKAGEADKECWSENTVGYWQGNCGYNVITDQDGRERNEYHKCDEENVKCGMLICKLHKNDEEAARQHVKNAIPNSKTTIGIRKHGTNDNYRCASVRFSPAALDQDDNEPVDVFVDQGQVADFTRCGEGLFCKSSVCTFEAPPSCPSPLNGTECGGHGECNNLNQCHCNKGWGGGVCVDSQKGDQSYKAIIIGLCIAVVIVPLIVGVLVFVFKHNFDMKKMKEEQSRIARGIRRFSSRAFSRQGSTRSDTSGQGNVKMPSNTSMKGYKRVPKIDLPTITTKPSKPSKLPTKNGTAKKTELRVPPTSKKSSIPNGNSKKIELRAAPPPPPPQHEKNNLSPYTSPYSSKNSTPNSSQRSLNGPPPVPPPPAPEAKAVLRNARDGLRPARLDARTHSETFKNKTTIPQNTLSDKPVSESNLTKKPLQPPKLLAGRSRESKKLQISGPSSTELKSLDGRPKSFVATTDIKQSSDSINTVSSTRALFDPKIKKKPPSRWN